MVDEGKVSTLQAMLTEEFTNTVCSPLRMVMLAASSQREKTALNIEQVTDILPDTQTHCNISSTDTEYYHTIRVLCALTCTGTCVYMHRYLCVHAQVLVCTCTGTCVYMHRYLCVHAQVLVCTCTGTCEYMHRYLCVHAQVLVCTCTGTCVYMHRYL